MKSGVEPATFCCACHPWIPASLIMPASLFSVDLFPLDRMARMILDRWEQLTLSVIVGCLPTHDGQS